MIQSRCKNRMENNHNASYEPLHRRAPVFTEGAPLLQTEAMLVSPVDEEAVLEARLTQTDHDSSSSSSSSFTNPSFRLYPDSAVETKASTRVSFRDLQTPDESGSWAANFRFLGLDPNENNDDDGSAQLLVSSASSPPPPTTSSSSRFKMPSPGGGNAKKRRNYAKLDIASTMGVPLLAEQMDENGEDEDEDVENEDTESVQMQRRDSEVDINSTRPGMPTNTSTMTTTTTVVDSTSSTVGLVDNRKPHDDSESKTKSSFLNFYANLESKTSNLNGDSHGDDFHNDDENDDNDDDNKSNEKKRFSSLNNLLDEDGMGQQEVEGMVVEYEDLDDDDIDDTKPESQREPQDYQEILPAGWERHESNDAPYYWHIKSGTIQLEPPEGTRSVLRAKPPPNLFTDEDAVAGKEHLRDFEKHVLKFAEESLKSLELGSQKSFEPQETQVGMQTPEALGVEKPERFSVKSLGWLAVEESDLTPERSSKAVNRCIVELSNPGSRAGSRLGGGSTRLDSIGQWGEGKELWMEMFDDHLHLIDSTETVLTRLSIQSIRVWGVGRDNERDFAYVARDKNSRLYLCHVFRCETPARAIANALRDACRRLMAERQKKQRAKDEKKSAELSKTPALRPGSLPMSTPQQRPELGDVGFSGVDEKLTSFPTPMEEPRKVIKADYLGSVQVPKPTGMEVLSPAIEKLSSRVPVERWQKVEVAVAPSTVQVIDAGSSPSAGETIAECRVRYLSFMGIGKDVSMYAFIMDTSEEAFICHVFHCAPSAAFLCKTIEAACKLRFQKIIDREAGKRGSGKESPSSTGSYSLLSPIGGSSRSGIGSSLKEGVRSMFNNLSQKLKTPQ